MIVGAVDLLRQPGWAWKRAEESKAAYLVLVVLVPLVGLALYVYKGRPKVTAIAAGRTGRQPPLRAVRRTDKAGAGQRDGALARRRGRRSDRVRPLPTTADDARGGAPSAGADDGPSRHTASRCPRTFFSSSGTATKTRPSIGLTRSYRPKQRTSLPVADDAAPTVPAGWKADPTGRHQFRYWDGFQWTENVADAGEQSRDAGQLLGEAGRPPTGPGATAG